jgi:hypothetical protein
MAAKERLAVTTRPVSRCPQHLGSFPWPGFLLASRVEKRDGLSLSNQERTYEHATGNFDP